MFFASHPYLRILITITLVLLATITSRCSVEKDRKAAATRLAAAIEQLHAHKIYVSDFLDSTGVRTERGCYFASVFSSNLAKQSKGFEVLNRISTQKLLDTASISPGDLQKPEILSKMASATGADAVLLAVITLEKDVISLDLSLRETSSGKEIHRTQYQERKSPDFGEFFSASADTSGQSFYFAGLDGVSVPQCVYCPQPSLPSAVKARKVSGAILISAHVTERGTIDDVRLVRSLDSDFDKAALSIVRTWKLQPPKDASGTVVPLRFPVEIRVHLN